MGRCVAIAIATVACLAAARAEDPPVVEFSDMRTNYFTGRDAKVGVIVRGGAVDGTLAWVLKVGNRPLAQGTVAVRHAGHDPTRVDVALALPKGREGIVIDATLITVLVDGAGERRGDTSKRVRMFPADPFANRRRWLESRQIALIDTVGHTAQALEAANVPFTLVPDAEDVAAIRPPVIVVGEGFSWGDRPKLAVDLAFVAARGVGILWLAPRDGEMQLPGTADEPGTVVTNSLILRRADVVSELDDRLDWCDWSEAEDTVVSPLRMKADGTTVFVRTGDGRTGWPWLEASFTRHETDLPSGKMVICGLGIVAHWHETPAARYLFAAILERLTRSTPVPTDGTSTGAPPPTDQPSTTPSQETEE